MCKGEFLFWRELTPINPNKSDADQRQEKAREPKEARKVYFLLVLTANQNQRF